MTQGVIYKGIGGFYTVCTDGGKLLTCRARGIFRRRGIKPLAGDRVTVGSEAGTDYIEEILPRKNLLARPPVANVDRLFIVASTTEPVPSCLVIDKLAAAALDREIEPVLVVTKPDLSPPDVLEEAYRTSGIALIVACLAAGAAAGDPGVGRVLALLPGTFSVFCGNSGVGKSTLLNALLPQADREVGEISHKLGRGRHTTREVEIYRVLTRQGVGLVADTPGFASFDLQAGGEILADNLQLCFPEIKARIGQCRFSGCTHLAEKGCAVRAALAAGEIAQSRYDSYVALYHEAKTAESTYK